MLKALFIRSIKQLRRLPFHACAEDYSQFSSPNNRIVIPAQAGIQNGASLRESGVAVKLLAAASLARGYASRWIPPCAGMTKQKLWVIVSACGISIFTGAAAQSPNPIIEKIQTMLAKPTVLCGRFDQTKQLLGMKKPLTSTGRFCVVNGKGILWRTLQPFPNTLRLTRDEIVNYQGDRVAMRLDAKQEPTVRMINSVLFSLMAGDLAQLSQLFEVDGKMQATSWHVELAARQSALAKAIGTISLDGGAYVKSIKMKEAGGDQTTIVFSAIQTGESAMQPEEAAVF